jgi:hypothetical protein
MLLPGRNVENYRHHLGIYEYTSTYSLPSSKYGRQVPTKKESELVFLQRCE